MDTSHIYLKLFEKDIITYLQQGNYLNCESPKLLEIEVREETQTFDTSNPLETSKEKYGCEFCCEKFSTKCKLDRHSVTHTDKTLHQCNVCLKKFSLKRLEEHKLTHVQEISYEHQMCFKKFPQEHKKESHTFKQSTDEEIIKYYCESSNEYLKMFKKDDIDLKEEPSPDRESTCMEYGSDEIKIEYHYKFEKEEKDKYENNEINQYTNINCKINNDGDQVKFKETSSDSNFPFFSHSNNSLLYQLLTKGQSSLLNSENNEIKTANDCVKEETDLIQVEPEFIGLEESENAITASNYNNVIIDYLLNVNPKKTEIDQQEKSKNTNANSCNSLLYQLLSRNSLTLNYKKNEETDPLLDKSINMNSTITEVIDLEKESTKSKYSLLSKYLQSPVKVYSALKLEYKDNKKNNCKYDPEPKQINEKNQNLSEIINLKESEESDVDSNDSLIPLYLLKKYKRKYQCQKFNKSSDLKSHTASHRSIKFYNCQICFKKFSTKRNLNHHIKRHTRQKSVRQCHVCKKKYKSKHYLAQHLLSHTQEYDNAREKPVDKTELKTNRLQNVKMRTLECNTRPKKCKMKSNLKKHLVRNTQKLDTVKSLSKCKICFEMVSRKKTLRRHKDIKSSKCPVCKNKISELEMKVPNVTVQKNLDLYPKMRELLFNKNLLQPV